MTTFANDTFTGTAGTLLSAHTPETGGSWVLCTGTSGTLQLTTGGRIRGSAASVEGDYLCQGVPGSADYAVQADLWSGSSTQTNYAGVFARSDASGGQNATTGRAYLGQYDHSPLAWQIFKAVNNSYTQVGSSFSSSLTASTTTTFKLTMTGTTIVLNVAGVDRVTATDSAVTAAGLAGVFISSGTSADNATFALDNFSATDAGGAASTFPPLPAIWHNPLLPQ